MYYYLFQRLLQSSSDWDDPYCTWCVPLWLIIIPKVVASLSILSSSYIIKNVVCDVEKNKRNAYHRIMVNMSVLDIIFSIVPHFIGSWAMPVGTAPLSAGNLSTCDAQGYVAQALSVAGPLCNASLSTYYNLIIKYGWSDHKLKRIEKWLHIVPATLGSLISIVPLVAKLYVPGTWGCWFGNTQYPMGCDSAETCERGWNSNYYFWPIFLLLWAAPCYVAGSMYLIYRHVRSLEQRLIRYNSVASVQSNAERREQERRQYAKSRNVMIQSLLYSGAMFLVLFWAVIAMMLPQFNLPTPLWVLTLFALCNPAQGIFNMMIHLKRTGQVPNINNSSTASSFLSRVRTSRSSMRSSIGSVAKSFRKKSTSSDLNPSTKEDNNNNPSDEEDKNNKNLSNKEEELNVCDGNISNEETLDLTDKFEENYAKAPAHP